MVADVVPINGPGEEPGRTEPPPVAEKLNPTCRICGVDVVVEGYADLADRWKESLERLCLCAEHEGKESERDRQERDMQRRTLYRGALDSARIPALMRGKTWSDLHETEEADVKEGEVVISAADATKSRKEALLACLQWARGDLDGLILAGRVGIGKSWFAAVAAQALISHRVKALDENHFPVAVMPLRWVNVPELIQKARGEIGSDRRRDAEKILDGNFGLVLDDIDKINPTEFSLDLLFEAVENRVNRNRPLLVTTNKGYVELKNQLGDPLASRLRGYCKGHRIYGNDRRK